MSQSIHTAAIAWRLGGDGFSAGLYSRAHEWRFDGGARIPAAASPHIVRADCTDPSAVDPEEAFVAALASCHMLLFLHFAARSGIEIASYDDAAEGLLELDQDGGRLTRVVLRPRVRPTLPEHVGRLDALHHSAHAACFLARSVAFPVVCEPTAPDVD